MDVKEQQVKPLGSRVLIEQTIQERVGMIFIPETGLAQQKDEGLIVGIGAEVTHVKVGDYVIYGKYSGMPLRLGQKRYLVLDVGDIAAVIDNSDTWAVDKCPKDMVAQANKEDD